MLLMIMGSDALNLLGLVFCLILKLSHELDGPSVYII